MTRPVLFLTGNLTDATTPFTMISVSHSWAANSAACAARRLAVYTTRDWDMARAIREAQSLIALDAIGPGLPQRFQHFTIGGRKIGDGKSKVHTMTAASAIAYHGDSVL